MKTIFRFFFLLLLPCASIASSPRWGFFLPDSVAEMTIQYRAIKGLIILPFTINDSIQVNLILDTGCRNLILFGKRFRKLFKVSPGKSIEFSGLGNGDPVTGRISLGNKVSMNEVLGEQIPVILVNSRNIFSNYADVHGVIGYDIFLKFEIELNARTRTIIFRPALKSMVPFGYSAIPLQIIDARPMLQSQIHLNGNGPFLCELMIDTGSALGLLVKTTNMRKFLPYDNKVEKVLGKGFNGLITGFETISQKLVLLGLEIHSVPTGIVATPWHNSMSIGMEVLKDYIVILNYCKAYACFKSNAS